MGEHESGASAQLEHPERVFVVSGPSGVGKNTLVARVVEQEVAVRAVTATSRAPRPGEVDGRDYYFTSEAQFEQWLREGRLLEHTRYCGHYYGTPAFSVNRATESGVPVLLVIEVDGAQQLKERWPAIRRIFIVPPSEDALLEQLRGRGDTSGQSMERRLERARAELTESEAYDWTVVNDQVERAAAELADIVRGAASS